MKIKNLTPHAVKLISESGDELDIPPEGVVARVAVTRTTTRTVLGIPVVRESLGDVQDLPDPEPGTALIVSRMVAEAARDRSDLFFPTDFVRDDGGNIVGARSLGQA